MGPAIKNYFKFNISLSAGSLSNFSTTLQSVTQNENGQFTLVMVASNVTVIYSSWKETYDYDETQRWIQLVRHIRVVGALAPQYGISTLMFTGPIHLCHKLAPTP